MASRVLLVLKVQQGHQAIQVHQDPVDQLERLVQRVLQDRVVSPVSQEQPAILEPPDSPEMLDLQDPMVKMAALDQRVTPGQRGYLEQSAPWDLLAFQELMELLETLGSRGQVVTQGQVDLRVLQGRLEEQDSQVPLDHPDGRDRLELLEQQEAPDKLVQAEQPDPRDQLAYLV